MIENSHKIHANRSPQCKDCNCVYGIVEQRANQIGEEIERSTSLNVERYRAQADCMGPESTIVSAVVNALYLLAHGPGQFYAGRVNANFFYYDTQGKLVATASQMHGQEPAILPRSEDPLQEGNSSL